MAANPNFDTIASSTLQNYRGTLQENLMSHQVLFWQLKQRGFITEDQGGRSIVVPLMYGRNNTVKSYQGYDLLDVTPQEGITSAEFNWKYLSGSVTISGQEEFENSGSKTRIFNLLDAKIRQLEISLQLELNKQLYADGSGNGGKNITGLALAVEDGAAWSTYGGIDSSTTEGAFWRNKWQDFDTAYGAASKFGDAWQGSVKGLAAFRKMRNDTSIGNSKPSLIITTQDIFEQYEAYIEGNKLRMTDTKLADAGFANIKFTDIPVVFDEDLAAETVLFLNADYIKFVIGKGRNFVTTPFVRPQNQDAKVSQTMLTANLITNKRDQHGRIGGLSVV